MSGANQGFSVSAIKLTIVTMVVISIILYNSHRYINSSSTTLNNCVLLDMLVNQAQSI